MAQVKTRDRQRIDLASPSKSKTSQQAVRSGTSNRHHDKSERAWRSRNPDRAIDRGR